jgi:hypothetical protein
VAQTDVHTVANEPVAEAVEHGCDVIVFEEPTDVRERLPQANCHHVRAFRRLFEYVSHEPPEGGISVEQVEPKTSTRCSRTDRWFTREATRHGERFCCQQYGTR